MNTLLKPYPSYSPSRVPWLNHIPTNWRSDRIASLFRLRKESGETSLRLLSVYLGKGVVPFESVAAKRTNVTSEDLSNYQIVEPGDFVLNNQQAWRGSVGVSAIRGITSPAYLVLRPIVSVIPEYISYLSVHPHLVQQYEVSSRGVGSIQRNLYWDSLRLIVLPLPTLEEQEQIVRFVRQLDSRVNRLIKAKRRLIELLNEQKQAIIHQAVTRGLDPTVPLKPSGLVWIPQVPSHWDVVPNGSLMKPKKRLVGERHTEYTLLSLTKQGVIVRDLSENKGKFSKDLGTSQEVKEGDLVFCLFDIPETPRTVGLSSHDGMITSAYTVMTPRDSEVARYVAALYIAMDNGKLLSPMYSGLRNTIAPSRFLSMRMPLPPKEERAQIVNFVEAESASIDATLAKVIAEIELIREYRTRLVADVVTGQLDVRQHPWANTEIEDPTEAITDDAELEDDLEETDDVLEEAGV